jgi:tRNA (cytidine/uridine-2'-O-)-methyltransferase
MSLHIVLFEPEIPPNTGNIIRLCANTGATLHLIEPLGFDMSDKALVRAGLDYHEFAQVQVHASWDDYKYAHVSDGRALDRIFGFSTKATKTYVAHQYQDHDALLFGPESRGLPDGIRNELGIEQLLILPMKQGSRSLNLSNTVAIGLYQAWSSIGFIPMDAGAP